MTKRRPLALGAAATIGFGSLFFAAPALAEEGVAPTTDQEVAEAPAVESDALTDDQAAEIEAALKTTSETSDVVVAAAGITGSGSFLVLTLDEDGSQSESDPEVAEVLSTFEAEVGADVEHGTVSEIATPYEATDVVGGAGYISYEGGQMASGCSIGFTAMGPSGPALITAGHCTKDGAFDETRLSLPSVQPAETGAGGGTGFEDNGTGVLGTFGFSQFGGPGNADSQSEEQYPGTPGSPDSVDSTDIAVIDVADGFSLSNEVTDWTTAAQDDLAASATPITSVGEPTVGAISKSGRTTGLTTGEINDTHILDGFQLMWADNANTNEGDPTRWVRGFSSSVNTAGGDSGGAMFQGPKAVGVVSGGTATYTWGTSLTHGLSQIPGDYQVLVADPNEVVAPTITAPADGSTVVAPVTEIAGAGEPGAEIAVTGDVTSTTTVGDNGEWTVPAELTEERDYTVTATQTANGETDDVSSTFTVAAEAPVVDPTITAPADGETVEGPVTEIAGSGEPGAEVAVTGAAEGETTVGENGEWTVPAEIADAGEYTVTATQTADEETAEASSTFTVTIEEEPEELLAPEVTSIEDGDVFGNEDAPSSVSGLGQPGAEVNVTLEGELYGSGEPRALSTQDIEPGTPLANTAEWTIDFDEQLQPGTYTLSATQTFEGETSPETVVSFEVTGADTGADGGDNGAGGEDGDAGTDDGDLANTGAGSMLPFALGAVLLLAAGGGAILIAQRRQAGAEL